MVVVLMIMMRRKMMATVMMKGRTAMLNLRMGMSKATTKTMVTVMVMMKSEDGDVELDDECGSGGGIGDAVPPSCASVHVHVDGSHMEPARSRSRFLVHNWKLKPEIMTIAVMEVMMNVNMTMETVTVLMMLVRIVIDAAMVTAVMCGDRYGGDARTHARAGARVTQGPSPLLSIVVSGAVSPRKARARVRGRGGEATEGGMERGGGGGGGRGGEYEEEE